MYLNDYEVAALHNVRRTAESGLRAYWRGTETLDAFQHILDELRIAGIHAPIIEGQIEMDFYEDKDTHETCPDCGKQTLHAKGIYEGGGVECSNCGYWDCY